MDGFGLQLPTIQNWNCHSCGDCCKRHVVEITAEERQRILDQGWCDDDEFAGGTPVLVRDQGPWWNRRWRLGQQSDGACVFLDERGLCRIHSKFGEPTKPLPCRVFPYAFHPAGNQVTVSLRFSCPSVVENRGQAVDEQRPALKQMAREVVPSQVTRMPSPGLKRVGDLQWLEFRQFPLALDRLLAAGDTPVDVRLRRAVRFIELIGNSRLEKLSVEQVAEFVGIMVEAAVGEVGDGGVDGEPEEVSRVGRLLFRMLAAQYARNDSRTNWQTGWRGRTRLMKVGLRFARGRGFVPPLQDIDQPVRFERLLEPFGGLTAEADEMFTRYFRVKVQGLQFCGRAFFGFGLLEGFRSLALVFPSILWLARLMVAAEGRDRLETADVARAIEVADHYHGYTPQFNSYQYRMQIRILARTGDIERLIAWYAR